LLIFSSVVPVILSAIIVPFKFFLRNTVSFHFVIRPFLKKTSYNK
jgi:hypothetical protein